MSWRVGRSGTAGTVEARHDEVPENSRSGGLVNKIRWPLTSRAPLLVACLVLMSAPLLRQAPAQALQAESGARDLHTIVAAGTLRVAMTRFDLPAFHVRASDGSFSGLEADLAREIADALKLKVVFNADYDSFDTVAEAVAAGRADIGLSKLSQTYYRVMLVRFSEPYVTLRHGLLYDRIAVAEAGKGAGPEEVLRDFRGRIGVIGKSAYEDFGRRNFPAATIVPLSSWEGALGALKARQVQAVYRDEFEIRRVLKNDPALNVAFGAAIITDQKAFLSIAICETCSKLQDFINYHLKEYPRAFAVDDLIRMAGSK